VPLDPAFLGSTEPIPDVFEREQIIVQSRFGRLRVLRHGRRGASMTAKSSLSTTRDASRVFCAMDWTSCAAQPTEAAGEESCGLPSAHWTLSSFKISERSNRLRSQRKLNFPQSCKLPPKAVQLESLYPLFRSLINREGHFSFDI